MTQSEKPQDQEKSKDKQLSRRNALKILAAAAGAATLSNLPGQWMKPVLRAGVLPAHAQTSGLPTANPVSTATPGPTATPQIIQGSLAVVLDWGSEIGQIDLNLEVYDPGSDSWATPANLNTLTLVHGGDAGLGDSGTETVDSTGGVVAGTYPVWLRVISTDSNQVFLIFASIDITANATNENRSIEFDTPPADNSTIHVADVTYPAGTINWLIP